MPRDKAALSSRTSSVVCAAILIASNVLVFQMSTLRSATSGSQNPTLRSNDVPVATAVAPAMAGGGVHGVGIPPGGAEALPSIRISEEEDKKIDRNIYGGAGDKKHLGGFTEFDFHGISPDVWKYMVGTLGVKSVLDVGCGRGVSTAWFALHGVEVLCAEGSHDAVTQTLLPDPSTQLVEHDFSRGPWWPAKTYDAVWCVEFTEHVGRNYQQNYVTAFRKAAFIFFTHSGWGGWHHVEVHDDDWWRVRFESYGFVFSDILTKKARSVASNEQGKNIPTPVGHKHPEFKNYNAQHLRVSLLVFINPLVASLPEHQHMMAEHGCYGGRNDDGRIHIECGGKKDKEKLTALPAEYKPLALDDGMDTKWENLIKSSLEEGEKEGEKRATA